jgi:serine palmitoyltransferase
VCPGPPPVSDSLNHTSIVIGARGSGAKVKCFEHNDAADLERVLRDAIASGQPRTHRPWRKILIIIEGVYSMEGEAACLREIVMIKKRYGAYLYLDEAHSIGAMGATGRGLAEHAGVDPADIDIMMGTFTKSFGAIGGYIAADRAVVDAVRASSDGALHASSLSTGCVVQALASLELIMGLDGTGIGKAKIRQLHDNANYVRDELARRGFEVLGSRDCPVIPIMLYNPSKIPAFSRECYDRGVAVVVVGFPATSVIESRARLCISAGHTRKELEWAVEMLDEAADAIGIKYGRGGIGGGLAPVSPSGRPVPPFEAALSKKNK